MKNKSAFSKKELKYLAIALDKAFKEAGLKVSQDCDECKMDELMNQLNK